MIIGQANVDLGILQYISGIPVIASPVGVNKLIISDEYNGFLANNETEWFIKLSKLIEDENLRNKFAERGLMSVKKSFEVNNFKKIFIKDFLNLKKNYN